VALSHEQLYSLARAGAKARLEELRAEMTAIQALVGGEGARTGRRRGPGRPAGGRRGRKRSKISTAGRARIAAAQRARWAKIKAARTGAKK
jgi:hypothetical protein